eukprot:TRINITY_DN4118_c0_g1_i1.p1 TRINITY_DN4118_c0_g1~~TRINITY_DN4118_c0_g1_i1.p1  ORF type:complete len:318 (+),score=69.86 TRINITY_DN4118_c0_g1_i1:50-1003(+)
MVDPLSRRKLGVEDDNYANTVRELLALRQQKVDQKKYDDAEELTKCIADETKKLRGLKEKDEFGRQDFERKVLQLTKRRQLEGAKAAAKECAENISAMWERKLQALSERHTQDAIEKEQEIQKKESRVVIFSSRVRDLQQAEEKLAASHCYKESKMCQRKIDQFEKQELQELEKKRQQRLELFASRTRMKHDAETRFAETQMRNALSIANRICRNNTARTHQRFNNIEQDMDHAHKMELLAKPGIGHYMQPHFIKLRPKKHIKSATMRGTQLLQQEQGSRHSQVPSLVDLYGSTLDLHHGARSLREVKFPVPPRPVD